MFVLALALEVFMLLAPFFLQWVVDGALLSSDRDLLLEESIADTDIFLALTNDDEANIMSSLLAKRLG